MNEYIVQFGDSICLDVKAQKNNGIRTYSTCMLIALLAAKHLLAGECAELPVVWFDGKETSMIQSNRHS